MKDDWDSLIQRADLLATERPESGELLTFYSALLRSQREIYEYLRSRRRWLPSGSLEQDLSVMRVIFPTLLKSVQSNAPEALASEAQTLLVATEAERDLLLIDYWHTRSDEQFFAKAFLQPYARWLADTGVRTRDKSLEAGDSRCPFCAGRPQVSVLQIKETSSESGGRDLLCATCLTRWPFRRVICASCGEEDPAKVGYYHAPGAPDYDHIRVEACDSCNHYIKAIDLTRNGLAVPLVDEVAAAPLDLWARDHGYTKIELNLVGL